MSNDLTVITVTHNSHLTVGGCLDAARGVLGESAEVIVVDNASSDDTVERVTARGSAVRVLPMEENLGFGRACNRAARESSAEWLLFMNPDVRLRQVALPAPDQRFGVGAGSLAPDGGGNPEFVVFPESGRWSDFVSETCIRFLPPRLARRLLRRGPPADWASGALMLVRREEFLEVGGFDERFFLYYEDRDLCHRFRRAGLPVRPVAGVAGSHVPGRSTTVSSSDREALSFAGWLEYTGIWRGQACADAAAARSLHALVTMAGILGRAGWSERARAKAREVGQILRFLEGLNEHVPALEGRLLPHAREALVKSSVVRGGRLG